MDSPSMHAKYVMGAARNNLEYNAEKFRDLGRRQLGSCSPKSRGAARALLLAVSEAERLREISFALVDDLMSMAKKQPNPDILDLCGIRSMRKNIISKRPISKKMPYAVRAFLGIPLEPSKVHKLQ